ncbi:HRDC domain-containing protein [Brachybacterium sp. JHP9]|uniref:HRDC domain-containing protein n=1 Tax=Brachybacterium equifaecis TaxID=2910770 RepID=A0ABT0R0T2_9MICO|nr:HRDC domain-containing protein [Brachybacterium equifaecis]MCL6423522.1 HRDC domain-containing protein [Brachybacterium equifaecis]
MPATPPSPHDPAAPSAPAETAGSPSSRRTRSRAGRAPQPARVPEAQAPGRSPRTRSAAAAPADDAAQAGPAATPLRAPRDGMVDLIDRIQPLLQWCERAATAPEEPIAVDVERASSYRYTSKAYLIQVRTDAAGTALIDPIAFTLPGTFIELMNSREWVLHAASQDLPSLDELGLRPARLFDTELAGRLLGMQRVGLGAVVEDALGLALAKEHSAADWSKRPLPEPWLIYAALDVEVLVEVRDIMAARLEEAGKTRWAEEEFAHLLAAGSPAPRAEPWRKLHGVGVLRSQRQMAVARSMWEMRDAIASREDLSPHRVLRDREIVEAAKHAETSREAFSAALPKALRGKDAWWQAARTGLTTAPAHLPDRSEPAYPPPHKLWSKKWPEVAERYLPVREAVAARAEELQVPSENLVNPGLLRTWIWENDSAGDEVAVRGQLEALGARPWQAELVAPVLCASLPKPESH